MLGILYMIDDNSMIEETVIEIYPYIFYDKNIYKLQHWPREEEQSECKRT